MSTLTPITIPSRLAVPRDSIAAFCDRWHVKVMELFGSVLRDDFRPDSDVDVMVTFEPDASVTLFDLGAMCLELGSIFGRRVDLLTRRGVEESRNPYRRSAILESARVVYAR